jgi:hypothetical protein
MTPCTQEAYMYSYTVKTVAVENRNGKIRYQHEETWHRMDTGELAASRLEWCDKPLATLHEFLESIGMRADCRCIDCPSHAGS